MGKENLILTETIDATANKVCEWLNNEWWGQCH